MENSKGFALVQVILILLVLSTVTATLLLFVNNNTINSRNNSINSQSYFYSKSGIEMARRIFDNSLNSNFTAIPFYCYGNGTTLTRVSGTYSTGNSSIDNSNIIFQVSKTTVGNTSTVTINSIGTVLASGNTSKSSQSLSYSFQVISAPPVAPSDAVKNPSPFLSNISSSKAIEFNGSSPLYYILNLFGVNITSPSIFIEISPKSIDSSDSVSFYTDFIKFKGSLDFGSLFTSYTLYVHDSNILGSSIGGSAYTKYGVVYFGSTIVGKTLPSGTGYYYFPNNTNLSSQSEINTLIKINSVSTINSTQLGQTITETLTSVTGSYK